MTTTEVADLFKKFTVMSPEEHPSTEDILNKQGTDFTLKGKTAIVTGGSSGIGVETVRALASRGARVFIAVRDVEKTKKVIAEIAAAHPNNGGLEILQLELDNLASVSAAADDFLKRSSQLNILINNAGVMSCPYQKTKDGFEYHFGVNHVAHFLFFKKLLPLLLKSSTPEFNSRVVCVSSSAHLYGVIDLDDLHFTKRGYNEMGAYGQSKTANIYMAREIENRYGKQGLHAYSLHPGGILTELQRHTTAESWKKMGLFDANGEVVWKHLKMKTVPQGAATTIWAAVGKDLEGKGGEYLEDAHISVPNTGGADGRAPHAYDDEAAKKLWEYSEKVTNGF